MREKWLLSMSSCLSRKASAYWNQLFHSFDISFDVLFSPLKKVEFERKLIVEDTRAKENRRSTKETKESINEIVCEGHVSVIGLPKHI